MERLYREYWEYGSLIDRAGVIWFSVGGVCLAVMGFALLIEEIEKGRSFGDLFLRSLLFLFLLGPFVVVFGPYAVLYFGYRFIRSYFVRDSPQ